MSERGREPYPIQWNAPATGTAQPAWAGPRPDAQLDAPAAQADAPAIGGRSSGDAPAAPQQRDARQMDASSADEQGAGPAAPGQLGNPWNDAPPAATPVGWAGEQQSAAGQSAPGDAGQYAAPSAPHAVGSDPADGGASESPRHDQAGGDADPAPRGGASPVGAVPAPVADAQAASPSNSYPSAPPSGGYPSAPPSGGYASAPPSNGYSSSGYESAPPQVVGQNDDLPEDSLTIGRSRSNSIVLDDMLVSRRHVVISADDEGLLLRDLGSRNGTFVNGRRVEQTLLHEGDRIGIGASTFEVRDGWLVSV